MVDFIAKGEECNNYSVENSFGWEFIGSSNSKFDDIAEFYQKTANSFKNSKSWDQAGSTYIKLAECYIKSKNDHEAAAAYEKAANCYKKISPIQAISCLQQAMNHFCKNGSFSMAAKFCKEVGELYEQQRNFEEAIKYFERATEFFVGEVATTLASQCKQKIAQLSAQLKQYNKAIKIFEEVAQEAVNSNLLRYGVRGHLLNAGICHLCKGDLAVAVNSLERYQVLDQNFSRTHEYELLTDLVTTYKEQDVEKFTEVLKDYDSLSPLDSWKTILLLRIKEDLKTKEQKSRM